MLKFIKQIIADLKEIYQDCIRGDDEGDACAICGVSLDGKDYEIFWHQEHDEHVYGKTDLRYTIVCVECFKDA